MKVIQMFGYKVHRGLYTCESDCEFEEVLVFSL